MIEEWPSKEAFDSKSPPVEVFRVLESAGPLMKEKGRFVVPVDPELGLKVGVVIGAKGSTFRVVFMFVVPHVVA